MTQLSSSQDWNVNENCLVPLSLTLKDRLRTVFEARYKLSTRVTWLPFEQDWARELDSLLPTRPTVRDVIFKAQRQNFEYRVANGLCKLLLNHSYQDCIEKCQDFFPQPSFRRSEPLSLNAEMMGKYIESLNGPNIIKLDNFVDQLPAWAILLNNYRNVLSALDEMGMGRTYAGELRATIDLTDLCIVLCPISAIPAMRIREDCFSECKG